MNLSRLSKHLMSMVMILGMILFNASGAFAQSGTQSMLNSMNASEWAITLLGFAIVVFFLIFLVLALVFYTVVVTKKQTNQ
ncbi:hypothetical protein KMW28_17645 [Flammeovirga yaeyamensis]|uniref:Uncharacterized protein n=1 Tax=Flammeovirga yaeyamensis TaxID=367791 RepID=A0AAX1N213_9BACT|nr:MULTISPECIES: hypothetical protein [Flammeovirga]ANQ51127.2 hypothetical protein MY04_3783 [Flammeovirga sp. MY04]MBB3698154.1 putative membrane protein [Flammeovirga yaeyamensis]NMF34489.1 hypothetical protein [Flammeovirga yaeyamensis]QWG01467.1 hypothetical protein KMW28_17645 [Flammeovirga yaeyamensis]